MTDFTIDGVLRADVRGTGRHSVTFERTYPTVRDDLWQALTDPERVARWFAPISGELRPGGTVTAHFDDGDATFEVTECIAPERVSFNWLHGGGGGGAGGFWALAALIALGLYPIAYLNLQASLANIDPAMLEAAQNLGGRRWRNFWKITLPLAMPGVFAGSTLAIAASLTKPFSAICLSTTLARLRAASMSAVGE